MIRQGRWILILSLAAVCVRSGNAAQPLPRSVADVYKSANSKLNDDSPSLFRFDEKGSLKETIPLKGVPLYEYKSLEDLLP